MLRRLRKGQSTAEYAIVIGLVIAAAVGMQIYVKRGLQGKMKDASDFKVTDNNTGAVIGATTQYEPDYNVTENMVSSRNAEETATIAKGGSVTRAITGEDTSSRTGVTKILGTQ